MFFWIPANNPLTNDNKGGSPVLSKVEGLFLCIKTKNLGIRLRSIAVNKVWVLAGTLKKIHEVINLMFDCYADLRKISKTRESIIPSIYNIDTPKAFP
jgi:hypothetical protein